MVSSESVKDKLGSGQWDGTSGSPWGRINFPFWVRSMVSSESVKDKLGSGQWDGRGPKDGFKVGEVEDYFVEWQPIGQILPNPPQPIQANGCNVNSSELFTDILIGGDYIELTPGAGVDSFQIFEVGEPDDLGDPIRSALISLDQDTEVTLDSKGNRLVVKVEGRYVRIDAELAETAMQIMVINNLRDPSECTGTEPVEVGGGLFHEFSLIHPEEDEVFGC